MNLSQMNTDLVVSTKFHTEKSVIFNVLQYLTKKSSTSRLMQPQKAPATSLSLVFNLWVEELPPLRSGPPSYRPLPRLLPAPQLPPRPAQGSSQ